MTPRISARFRSTTLRYAALGLALAIGAGLALSALPAGAAPVYDPLNVVSDETLRAAGSLSQADIQAFLNAQTGVLKTYKAAEGGPSGLHSAVVKPASQIIYEAAQYWNVNPKLILCTLQKEQSLLTMTAPSSTRLSRAMGCGVYSGSPDTHPGFGDQVWTGTQKLGQTTGYYTWYPGKPKQVYSYPDKHDIIIVPANQMTWNLYTYTPYYPQKGIWDIYVRYFGDPLAPPRLKPIYEFVGKRTKAYFYTSSEAQRYQLTKDTKNWSFRGATMSADTSAPLNTVPLWRLKNSRTGRYILTACCVRSTAVGRSTPCRRSWPTSRSHRSQARLLSIASTTRPGTPTTTRRRQRSTTPSYAGGAR
jgi:hypothetical protein